MYVLLTLLLLLPCRCCCCCSADARAALPVNNGCDIGCDKCDGVTGQKIPCCSRRFSFNGTGSPPAWSGEGLVLGEAYKNFDRDAFRPKFVKYPQRKATLCDPRARTLNTDAPCGSKVVKMLLLLAVLLLVVLLVLLVLLLHGF